MATCKRDKAPSLPEVIEHVRLVRLLSSRVSLLLFVADTPGVFLPQVSQCPMLASNTWSPSLRGLAVSAARPLTATSPPRASVCRCSRQSLRTAMLGDVPLNSPPHIALQSLRYYCPVRPHPSEKPFRRLPLQARSAASRDPPGCAGALARLWGPIRTPRTSTKGQASLA